MLKKIGFVIFGMCLVASPLVASADTLSDLQAQVQALLSQITQLQQPQINPTMPARPAMPSRVCPQLLRPLSQGSKGSDVTSMQSYLGVSQTGFFGPLTASAVAQFQASEGLSQVGIVGPLTRAAFARRCGNPNNQTFSASPTSGFAPLNVNFYSNVSANTFLDFGDGQTSAGTAITCTGSPCPAGFIQMHTYTSVGTYTAKLMQSDPMPACSYATPPCMMTMMMPVRAPQVIGTVTIIVTNGSTTGVPSISGIDGPTQLTVGQSGSWSVHVNDASGYLSYSVHWGDEAPMPLMYGTASSMPVVSSGTFTHTYANAGTYTPTFTVTNGNRQSASASASVVVGATNAGTFSATPTSGSAPLAVHFAASNMTTSPGTIHDWYTVDFGDGTSGNLTLFTCSGATGCADHTYAQSGTYTANIVHHPDPSAYCPTTGGTYCGSTLTFNTVTINAIGI